MTKTPGQSLSRKLADRDDPQTGDGGKIEQKMVFTFRRHILKLDLDQYLVLHARGNRKPIQDISHLDGYMYVRVTRETTQTSNEPGCRVHNRQDCR